jgi:hypothetical protein
MDYSWDSCYSEFTPGQAARVTRCGLPTAPERRCPASIAGSCNART